MLLFLRLALEPLKLRACIALFVSVTAGTQIHAQEAGVRSSPIDALLEEPGRAHQFDYCQWRFKDGGKQNELPDFELLLDRERTALSARVEAAHALADAGTKIALGAKKRKQCEVVFLKGQGAFDGSFAMLLGKIDRRGPSAPSTNAAHLKIQERIIELWREDQAARSAYTESRTEDKQGAEFWHRRLSIARALAADATSTDYIRDVLEQVDWVDSLRFGEDISAHAWLLVQHADKNPEIQVEVLERMSEYLDNGGVRKRDYAYLWDRAAVNQGRLQRYGTQPDWECKPGGLALMPMEDEDDVDARRFEMGIGPVQNKLCRSARQADR